MLKWFMLQNETVTGPFMKEQVEEMIQSKGLESSCLIWGPALNHWVSAVKWQEAIPQIMQNHEAKQQAQVKQWYYSKGGETYGPMSKPELLESIVPITGRNDILLWTKGMTDWTPLFEFEEIVQELGINHRKTPRAEIEGKVIINHEGQTYIGSLKTISEGGFGVSGISGLAKGQEVTAEIKSEKFFFSLRTKAEVRYTSSADFIGFQFTTINVEARSAIVEFIKANKEKIQKVA